MMRELNVLVKAEINTHCWFITEHKLLIQRENLIVYGNRVVPLQHIQILSFL